MLTERIEMLSRTHLTQLIVGWARRKITKVIEGTQEQEVQSHNDNCFQKVKKLRLQFIINGFDWDIVRRPQSSPFLFDCSYCIFPLHAVYVKKISVKSFQAVSNGSKNLGNNEFKNLQYKINICTLTLFLDNVEYLTNVQKTWNNIWKDAHKKLWNIVLLEEVKPTVLVKWEFEYRDTSNTLSFFGILDYEEIRTMNNNHQFLLNSFKLRSFASALAETIEARQSRGWWFGNSTW